MHIYIHISKSLNILYFKTDESVCSGQNIRSRLLGQPTASNREPVMNTCNTCKA